MGVMLPPTLWGPRQQLRQRGTKDIPVRSRTRHVRPLALAAVVALGSSVIGVAAGGGAAAKPKPASDSPGFLPYSAGHAPALAPEAEGPAFQAARDAYFADRVYSGSKPLSVEQVAKLHGKAAAQAATLQRKGKNGGSASPSTAKPAPTLTAP